MQSLRWKGNKLDLRCWCVFCFTRCILVYRSAWWLVFALLFAQGNLTRPLHSLAVPSYNNLSLHMTIDSYGSHRVTKRSALWSIWWLARRVQVRISYMYSTSCSFGLDEVLQVLIYCAVSQAQTWHAKCCNFGVPLVDIVLVDLKHRYLSGICGWAWPDNYWVVWGQIGLFWKDAKNANTGCSSGCWQLRCPQKYFSAFGGVYVTPTSMGVFWVLWWCVRASGRNASFGHL